jgi:hypothetical protein
MIPYEQRAKSTTPTRQNRYHTSLNQQVPGSRPGRRTEFNFSCSHFLITDPNGRTFQKLIAEIMVIYSLLPDH